MPYQNRVLVVEDSELEGLVCRNHLLSVNCAVDVVMTGADARNHMQKHTPDIVLLDLHLPDDDGEAILQWMKQQNISSYVVVVTSDSSVDIVVKVMQLGAEDFIEKPVSASRLTTTVKNLLEKRHLHNLVRTYEDNFTRSSYEGFIGSCLPMQAVYRMIESAASSNASVFITGESGTGKELCAKALHGRGRRAAKPFIALNCSAIHHDLMESEIFGHVKGAFTGAVIERKGAAELADGGTLFLDEIAEMDINLQTKLLRFIQTGTFQKVGGSSEQKVNIRFICATNRNPLVAIEKGCLREDLYYRLHVVPIELPPLRARAKDIIMLARSFLMKYTAEEGKGFRGFCPEVERLMLQFNWPGNVRELQNVVRNIAVLHDGEKVSVEHLPKELINAISNNFKHGLQYATYPDLQPSFSEEVASFIKPLAEIEREAIESAVAYCQGNVPKAAGLLDVSPSTIYRKIQSWS